MPHRSNKIKVKWLESRDPGKTHRINVKYVVGQLVKIAVGTEVVVRFNAKRYRGMVMDLLDWAFLRRSARHQRLRSQRKRRKMNRKRKNCKGI